MDIIYDVGANDGDDSDFYLKKGFRVVAIEANPELCKFLRNRFQKEIDDGHYILEECAIAEKASEVTLYINRGNHHWSSIIQKHGERLTGADPVKVEAYTLDQIIMKHGDPYYVKIDLEGLDFTALKQLKALDFNSLPKYVSVEGGAPPMLMFMDELGYKRYNVADQSKVHLINLPNPPLEGNYIEYNFRGGSSGPFGRELPNKWITLNEAIENRNALAQARATINETITDPVERQKEQGKLGWFDVHAER